MKLNLDYKSVPLVCSNEAHNGVEHASDFNNGKSKRHTNID